MATPKTDDDAWLRRFQQGSPIASAVFGAALLIVLIGIFFAVPNPTDFQRQIARWIVAISSSFLALFFVGGIIVRGSIKGIQITAVGSIGLFVLLVALVDPFPKVSAPPGTPVWAGGSKLRGLLTELADAYADGRIMERITIDPTYRDAVLNFKLESAEWTGRTWVELLQRICLVTSCLKCTLLNKSTLEVGVSAAIEKHCIDAQCGDYWYTCKQ